MSQHPPADDPYDASNPTHFAPVDRAGRLKIALQLCARRVEDLRELVSTVETPRIRSMLYGYIAMEIYEGRQAIDHVSNEVKNGRPLPPHNNNISEFIEARKRFDAAQRMHLPHITSIRNSAVAHVDQNAGTRELRDHVEMLSPEHVDPVADAFTGLVSAIRRLPIGQFYAVPGPNQRIAMMPLRMEPPDPPIEADE